MRNLVALAILAGCPAAHRPPAAPPAAASGPFAVLRAGSVLRPRPGGADCLAFAAAGDLGLTVRVVGESGGQFEVETEPDVAVRGPCAPASSHLGGLRLRLYADGAAQSPLVVRPTRVAYADGTSVELAPGLVAEPTAEAGWWRFRGGGLDLAARLPAGALGRRFAPAAAPDLQSETRLGGWAAVGGRVVFVPSGAAGEPSAPHPAGELRDVSTTCARLRAVFPPLAENREEGGVLGALGGLGYCPVLVRAGAVVSWEDGSPAGEAVEEFCASGAVTDVGTRVCVELDGAEADRCDGGVARLCFEVGDLDVRDDSQGVLEVVSDEALRMILDAGGLEGSVEGGVVGGVVGGAVSPPPPPPPPPPPRRPSRSAP